MPGRGGGSSTPARRAFETLKPDGAVLMVEPMGGARVEDNFNPIGRLSAGASVLVIGLCAVSCSLDAVTALPSLQLSGCFLVCANMLIVVVEVGAILAIGSRFGTWVTIGHGAIAGALTAALLAVSYGVVWLLPQLTSTIGPAGELFVVFAVGVLLWIAWRRRDLLRGYRYPRLLAAVGTLAWLLTLYLGYQAILDLGSL